MSNVAALNFKQELAEAEVIAARKKAEMADATVEALLDFKSELKSATVAGIGVVYFYDPPRFEDTFPYLRTLRDEDDTASAKGVVDSLIRMIRDAKGQPLLKAEHRAKLLLAPPGRLAAMWAAVGGNNIRDPGELVGTAEKN